MGIGTESPSISGASYGNARSFAIVYTTSAMANSVAIAAASYNITATTDCWVRAFGTANTTKISAVPGSTQPAVGSENQAVFCPAGTLVALDLPSDTFISAIAVTTGGTLNITGPIHCLNTAR